MPERTTYAPGTPCWVDLAAPNPNKAKQFYSNVLGWEWTDEPTDGGPPYHMARLNGLAIAGMMQQGDEMRAQGVPALWSTYIAVADCDKTTKAAEKAGATVVMHPMDVMDHGRMSLIADPTGAMVGLWQARGHIGAQLVNEPGSLCWNELQTGDVPKATAFYTKVFGLKAETAPMDGMDYTILSVGDDGIAGLTGLPMEGVPPNWFVTFAVDDAEEAVDRIKDAGGTILMGPMDIMPGRFVVFADNQGAPCGVIKLAPPS